METDNHIHHGPEEHLDKKAIQEVIGKVKSKGLFDQFRKECLADVDTKPAYHNLLQRVEKFVEHFLHGQKWSANVNKNQLRETLRRQLNNSGMMNNGVERIIEQVVNPKILLGIKPKIDEAVSEHLGIDLKSRQEEEQRRKHEQQQLLLQQHQLQQEHMQSLLNQKVKPGEEGGKTALPPGVVPSPGSAMWPQGIPGMGFPTPPVSGAMGPPDSAAPGGLFTQPGTPGGLGTMMLPGHLPFMGGWTPPIPGMEPFNHNLGPMIPGQPMIPPFQTGLSPGMLGAAVPFSTSGSPGQVSVASSVFSTPGRPPGAMIPDFSKPPPGLPGTPSSASGIGSSPMVPPGVTSAGIRPPPPNSVPPPPGTVPVTPPGAPRPTVPTIPALISHTLSKVSEDELTPEKIAVFKTAAAFITKTVSNAQSTPGADLATMFSPQVLAEAMMAESGKPLTKQEIRAAKRKERMRELEKLKEKEKEEEEKRQREGKSDDKEDPLPPQSNLMDVFQGAEDVSDDDEALDMLMDADELEDKHQRGIVLSDDSDKEKDDQAPTNQRGKRYNFAWDVDKDLEELSDVTMSSVHTSDISSFEEDPSSDEAEKEDEEGEADKSLASEQSKGEDDTSQPEEDQSVTEKSEPQPVDTEKTEASEADEEGEARPATTTEDESTSQTSTPVATAQVHSTPNTKLVQKSAEEKAHGQAQSKRRKLVALSYRYSDSEDDESREERKARIAREKEERYLKRQQRRAEMEAKKKEREEEKARLKEEKKKQKEQEASQSFENLGSEESTPTAGSVEQVSPTKSTPRKRKNKAQLKEELLQQKVLERKAALRRQRTRNKKYASDEFTSIFSERKALTQSYTDTVIGSEEIVTFDGALEVVEMTVDQECVIESTVADDEKKDELVLQCPSPYSDISDRSMSDRMDEKISDIEMENVSSDDDLGDDFVEETTEDSARLQSSSVSEDSQIIDDKQVGATSVAETDTGNASSSQTDSESAEVKQEKADVDGGKRQDAGQKHFSEADASAGTVEICTEVKEEQSDSIKATEPVDIMGELELEPVSDEDSPFDDAIVSDGDKEEGEEKDSDTEVDRIVTTGKELQEKKEKEGENEDASDEGEIKSDSDEPAEPTEEEKERIAKRKPIQFVDFGEAARRARESRGYYPEADRTRTRTPQVAAAPYGRGGFTSWQTPETSSPVPYAGGRYMPLDGSQTSLSKSPAVASFDGESESSSHSRASVRMRDDVPPPYPIEGISRKGKSPASDQGSLLASKSLSAPSPVSHSSQSSRSRSKSRSRSRSSSTSSSSETSKTSRHKRHKSKRRKRKRRRETGSSEKAILSGYSSPVRPQLSPVPVEPGAKVRRLSSGHESISSDELPDFGDEEEVPQPAINVKGKRQRSLSAGSSSSSSSDSHRKKRIKRGDSPGKESISSSELIYSPGRLRSLAADDQEIDLDDIPKPPMSPGRSSISSGELPEYPGDFDGFQPPLSPSIPPEEVQPPLPPLPPSPAPLPPSLPPGPQTPPEPPGPQTPPEFTGPETPSGPQTPPEFAGPQTPPGVFPGPQTPPEPSGPQTPPRPPSPSHGAQTPQPPSSQPLLSSQPKTPPEPQSSPLHPHTASEPPTLPPKTTPEPQPLMPQPQTPLEPPSSPLQQPLPESHAPQPTTPPEPHATSLQSKTLPSPPPQSSILPKEEKALAPPLSELSSQSAAAESSDLSEQPVSVKEADTGESLSSFNGSVEESDKNSTKLEGQGTLEPHAPSQSHRSSDTKELPSPSELKPAEKPEQPLSQTSAMTESSLDLSRVENSSKTEETPTRQSTEIESSVPVQTSPNVENSSKTEEVITPRQAVETEPPVPVQTSAITESAPSKEEHSKSPQPPPSSVSAHVLPDSGDADKSLDNASSLVKDESIKEKVTSDSPETGSYQMSKDETRGEDQNKTESATESCEHLNQSEKQEDKNTVEEGEAASSDPADKTST